jgi:hypothetical protein
MTLVGLMPTSAETLKKTQLLPVFNTQSLTNFGQFHERTEGFFSVYLKVLKEHDLEYTRRQITYRDEFKLQTLSSVWSLDIGNKILVHRFIKKYNFDELFLSDENPLQSNSHIKVLFQREMRLNIWYYSKKNCIHNEYRRKVALALSCVMSDPKWKMTRK